MVILSEKEVLDCLSFFGGWEIPRSRFDRWREKGLLVPSQERGWVGPGRGRSAFGYSLGSVEQAAQIAQMLNDNLNFDEIGWRLWLAGYPVGSKYWLNPFEWAAKQYDSLIPTIREAQESDELSEGSIETLIAKAWRSRKSNRLFKRIKKSLGPTRFKAVMDQVLNMATGAFAQISSEYELGSNERHADMRTMDVALGLGHARTDIVGGDKRIINAELDYSSILRETFEPLGQLVSMASVVETIDPERLRIVTKSLTLLLRSIAAASAELDRLLVRDAFGLNRVADFARVDRNLHAGMALVWMIIHNNQNEKTRDLESVSTEFLAAAIAARKLFEKRKLDPDIPGPEFRRASVKRATK